MFKLQGFLRLGVAQAMYCLDNTAVIDNYICTGACTSLYLYQYNVKNTKLTQFLVLTQHFEFFTDKTFPLWHAILIISR